MTSPRDDVRAEVVDYLLRSGVRNAMRTAIGDRTPRQFDAADTIAESVDCAVANLLAHADAAELRQRLAEVLS